MKSILFVSCLCTLLLMPACLQKKAERPRLGNTIQDSTVVGHWFERIEDRKRIKVEAMGTGRELLDEFYKSKTVTHQSNRPGGTTFIYDDKLYFVDTTSLISSPCVIWYDGESHSDDSTMRITIWSHITPRIEFDHDFLKIQ